LLGAARPYSRKKTEARILAKAQKAKS